MIMHDSLELVARPEEVVETLMIKGLVWRTASKEASISPVAPPLLANLGSGYAD